MTSPPPFRSKHNPYTTDVDWAMNSPLDANGDNFPCKGYHNLLNSPQGRSVATWRAGSVYTFSVEGSAVLNGGSCQVSLSYDDGTTWTVVRSYIGGCPLKSTWVFKLPNDTPAGDKVLFAWSWFNNVGNRDMYMNCAHVTIQAGGLEAPLNSDAKNSFASRPAMFVANVNNGCVTSEGCDVSFPNLGPDVLNISLRPCPPVGNCG